MLRYLLCTLLFFPTSLLATSYTWNGGTSTDWNTGANWTPSGVPTSGDNVTIVSGTNQPLLDQARTITNLTVTSGTLDLNTYTLTVNGTGSCSGGNVNNGTVSFAGTTVTFSGTTFGAKVTANCTNIYFNSSVFNGVVNATKTGSTTCTSNGGNKFNDSLIVSNTGTGNLAFANTTADTCNGPADFSNSSTNVLYLGYGTSGNVFAGKTTFTNSSIGNISICFAASSSVIFNGKAVFNASNGIIHTAYSSGSSSVTFNDSVFFNNTGGTIYTAHTGTTTFNGHISLTSTAGSSYLGYNGSASLASGKTVSAGIAGFTAGNVQFKNFTQNGTTAQSLTLTSSGACYLSTGTTFNGVLTISAPAIYFNGTTFNKKVDATKTGGGTATSNGGNKFNDSLIVTNSGTGTLYFANTNPDTCNSVAEFTNSSTNLITVGYNTSGNVFNGKTTFTNTGIGNINVGQTSSSGVTFNAKTTFNNSSTGLMYVSYSAAGSNTTFNDTAAFNNTSTGTIYTGHTGTTTYNSHVVVSSTTGGSIYLGYTGSASLASGKNILIGSGGFSAGSLYMKNFTQNGSTAQSITLSGTAVLRFSSGSTFNGNVTGTSPRLMLDGTKFNETATLEKTGGTNDVSAGGNIFNGTTTVTNSGSAYLLMANTTRDTCNAAATFISSGSGDLYVGYTGGTFNGTTTFTNTGTAMVRPAEISTCNFNENIIVNSTNGNGVQFHRGTAGGNPTLASGKTITVGGAGFSAGTLWLEKFVQNGSTPQNITLTGSASLVIGINCAFNGNVNFTAPGFTISTSTFNGTATFEKTGSSSSGCYGSNTFNGAATIINSGTGLLQLASNVGDTFNADATFTNTNTTGMYVARAGTNSFNGNILVNNTAGSNSGILFGYPSGGTSSLASGKTISVGGSGFSTGSLYLKGFSQNGTTLQTITLTGTALLQLDGNNTFNGNVTFTAPQLLLSGTTFNGTATLEKNGATDNSSVGGNIFNSAATIKNSGSGFLRLANTNADDFNGNVTFIKTGSGSLDAAYNGTNTFAKDITVTGAITFNGGTGTVKIDGSTSQFLNADNGNTSIKNLVIDKSAFNLTLNTPLTVSAALTLTKGNIVSSTVNNLILNDNITVNGASSSSFVSGPVKKIGNDAFTFPLGRNNNYQPLVITAPSNVTDAYTAQYFDYAQESGYTLGDSIYNINNCEYWKFDRNTGSSNAKVTLGWNSKSCNLLKAANSRVVYWNGTSWTNLGNGGTTGNDAQGTVITQNTVTAYGYFSLGNYFPKTKLKSTYCNTTGYGLTDTVAADTIVGASSYEFFVHDSTGYVKYYTGDNTAKLPLSQISGLQYGSTYKIAVRSRIASLTGSYGDTCQVTIDDLPVTKLTSSYCNVLNIGLGDTLKADTIPGTFKYEFVIKDTASEFTRTYTRNATDGILPLLAVDSLRYGKTYRIAVRYFAGNDTSGYGDTCLVSMKAHPLTKLISSDCNISNLSLGDTLNSTIVHAASKYIYLLRDTTSGATYSFTRVNTDGLLIIDDVSGLRYNRTYSVKVRTVVAADTSVYGDSCYITLKIQPLTKLQPQFCNVDSVGIGDTLLAVVVPGAEKYEFHIMKLNGGLDLVYTRNSSDGKLPLSNINDLLFDSTYKISVRSIVGTDTTAWSDTCLATMFNSIVKTKLDSLSCNKYQLDTDDEVFASPIQGTGTYQFKVTNPDSNYTYVFTRNNPDGRLFLDSLAGLQYKVTYKVNIRAIINNDTSAYGDTCRIKLLPKTKVAVSDCGDIMNLRDTLDIDTVSIATGYRLTFLNDTCGFLLYYTINNVSAKVVLDSIEGIHYGKTYHVLARAFMTGGDTAEYGDTCKITLIENPKTKLITADCGRTNMGLTDTLTSDTIQGAANYVFFIRDTAAGDTTAYYQYLETGNNTPKLFLTNARGMEYGKVYRVNVGTVVGGAYSNFGDTCLITTKAHPLTKLSSTYCNTSGRSLSDTLTANNVAGALTYCFFIKDTASGATYSETYYRYNSDGKFILSDLTGAKYGKNYLVKVRTVIGNDTSAYGDTCYIGVISLPATKLAPAYCGVTGISMSDSLQANIIGGATTYVFYIKDTAATPTLNTVKTVNNKNGKLPLLDVAGLKYGITYSIKVRAIVTGDTSAYGDSCLVRLFDNIPLTQLDEPYCDTVNITLRDTAYAKPVSGATAYQFEIKDTATGTIYLYLRNSPDRMLPLSLVNGLKYATGYRVRVRALVNNDTANYGTICYMTTDTVTQLSSIYCDSLNAALSDTFYADVLSGASAYEFFFKDTASSFTASWWRNSSDAKLFLASVPGLKYNRKYEVQVRAKTGSDTTGYGPVCYISTKPYPLTQLKTQWCDSSGISIQDTLQAVAVPKADAYVFMIEDTTTGFREYYLRDSSDGKFPLVKVNGLRYGRSYLVKVKSVVGDTSGSYGDTCSITLVSHPKTKLSATWCNASNVKIGDTLQANIVAGADIYEFVVKDTAAGSTFNKTYIRDNADGKLFLSEIDSIRYNRNYSVKVRTIVDGDTSAFGDTCYIAVIAIPLTKLDTVNCNRSGLLLNDTLKANVVPGAYTYQFFIKDSASAFSTTYTRNSKDGLLLLSGVSGFSYRKTYLVKVRTVSGGDTSAYGDTCYVRTANPVPVTAISDLDCAKRDLTLDAMLSAGKVPGSAKYLFTLKDSASSDTYSYTRDSSDARLPLASVSGLKYGKTYRITVRAVVSPDTAGNGDTCYVAMQSTIPVTTLDPASCGTVNIDTTSVVYAQIMTGASKYLFLIKNDSLSFNTTYARNNSDGMLPLDSVSGWQYGATYNVLVKSVLGTDTSAYGDTCTITFRKDTSLTTITWSTQVGIEVSGSTITKTTSDGWTNARVASSQEIPAGSDGAAEFTVPSLTTSFTFGLADEGTPYDSLDYSVRIENGVMYIYENGTNLGRFADVAVNDKIRIERKGNEIIYRRNYESFANTFTNTALDLQVQSVIYNLNATVTNLKGIFSIGISDPACNCDMNWQYTRAYDGYGTGPGNVIAESKVYMDNLGRTIQTQTRSITESMVLASQQLYDELGRPVISTLPAPINEGVLCYKYDFVLNPDGKDYTFSDYDLVNTPDAIPGERNNPRALRANTGDIGTVGWYYSDQNTMESYVDRSEFPYTRSEYDDNNPGSVKRSAAPGDELRMGKGRETKSFSMQAAGELHYVFGYGKDWYLDIVNTVEGGGSGLAIIGDFQHTYKIVKTISVDPDGNETVVFTSMDGKTVAACRSGIVDGKNMRELAVNDYFRPYQRYVDIHLPAGCESSLRLAEPADNSITYRILDLVKDEYVKFDNGSIDYNGTTPNLPPGFYRIIDMSLPASSSEPLPVRYTLNYYDFTLNYYDRAGRLIGTVPPAGIDDIYHPKNVIVERATGTENFVVDKSYNWSLQNSGTGKEIKVTRPAPLSIHEQFANLVISLMPKSSSADVTDVGDEGDAPTTFSKYAPKSINTQGTENVKNTMGASLTSYTVKDPGSPSSLSMEGPKICNCPPVAQLCYEGTQLNATTFGKDKCRYDFGQDASIFPLDPSNPSNNKWCIQCFDFPETPVDYVYEISYKIYSNTTAGTLIADRTFRALYDVDNNSWAIQGEGFNATSVGTETAATDVPATAATSVYLLKVTGVKEETKNSFGKFYQTYEYKYLDKLKISLDVFMHNVPTADNKPDHKLGSKFEYNSLNWQITSILPDEGKTEFVYRKDGKPRFSQNEVQRVNNQFSYINYDKRGRVVETGVYQSASGRLYFQNHKGDINLGGETSVLTVLESEDGLTDAYCSERVITYYDLTDASGINSINTTLGLSGNDVYKQRYLLGKVSKTERPGVATTWYSYDEQGQVEWSIRQIEGMTSSGTGNKIVTANYEYDRSGDATKITYQKESSGSNNERFEHKYTYDADKRLKDTKTVTYNAGGTPTEQQEATYIYYMHGPLKRTELAVDLQGIDYTYNINGLLKAINHPGLDDSGPGGAVLDPGKDGFTGSHSAFAKDAFGMALDYYTNDYTRSSTYFMDGNDADKSYYGGNIRSMRWQNRHAGSAPPAGEQWMYTFTYDNRNWLASANFASLNPSDYTTPVITSTNDYKVWGVTYDANGNLKTMKRYGYGANDNERKMDEFTYKYNTFTLHNQTREGNRLLYLDDMGDNSDPARYADLEDQNSGNYAYYADGSLKDDTKEDNHFEYNAAGLVTEVWNKAKTIRKAEFLYDAMGMRLKKTSYDQYGVAVDETWYVYDGGRLMSIYRRDLTGAPVVLQQTELPIYGASRIGMLSRLSGTYTYELSDHLGNVRATIDRVKQSGEAVFLSYADYYPFGWTMPGHVYVSGSAYRYGYQGQYAERDPETSFNSFEARMYDGRLGRWSSPDPAGQFASSYLAMGNSPMIMIDPNGEFAWFVPVIFAGVNLAVDAIQGNINSVQDALLSVLEGAIQGTFAAVGAGGIDKVGTAIIAALLNQIPTPSITLIDVEGFRLSLSPTFAFGSHGLRIGTNLGWDIAFDDLRLHVSTGIAFNKSAFDVEQSGIEIQRRMALGIKGSNGQFMISSASFANSRSGVYTQSVQSAKFGGNNWSFGISNDWWLSDKGRTVAAEFSYNNFVLGTSIFTSDHGSIYEARDNPWKSKVWGRDKDGAYYEGDVKAGILYFGYKTNNGKVYRLGIDAPSVQDFFQNGWHQAIGSPAFMTPYRKWRKIYTYFGTQPDYHY